MQRRTVDLGGSGAAKVWTGGEGPPLVLLHGGWAGAEAHWSAVWETLSAGFSVVAPELPGIGTDAEPLRGYEAFVDWIEALLGALGVEGAVVVGNSFGATLAWLLALRHASRCRRLVMVDGLAPPQLPATVRALLRFGPLRRMALGHMRRNVYGTRALQTAFHDSAKAPQDIRAALMRPDDRRIDAMLDAVIASRTPAARPAQSALIVWGADDRLPQADVSVGRKLHAGWPGSRFVVIDRAGHLPQVEQPRAFVEALRPFAREAGG